MLNFSIFFKHASKTELIAIGDMILYGIKSPDLAKRKTENEGQNGDLNLFRVEHYKFNKPFLIRTFKTFKTGGIRRSQFLKHCYF